jgi:hypothetical protein
MTVFPLSRCILMIDKFTGAGRFNARGPMRLLGREITAKRLGIRHEADKKGVMAMEELRTMERRPVASTRKRPTLTFDDDGLGRSPD